MNSRIFTFLIIISFLVSCSGTRNVTINTMRPAEISVPSEIKTIVIVDRTLIDQNAVNIIEGLVTGEMPGEDKMGTQELMNSFKNKLIQSPRFEVKTATERIPGNSLTAALPDQLPWSTVRDLCKKYNAQAVVAIEVFDTDFIVTNGKKKVKEKVKQGNEMVEIEVMKYYAEGVGNLNVGIRMYDLNNRQVVDQQSFKQTNKWEATGNSLQDAMGQLIAKSDATRYLSKRIGNDYAYKIAPMPITLNRSFRGKSKKCPALERGARLADVGNWEDALVEWKKGIRDAEDKEAGYLTYNMAVAYEVLGDFDSALSWAEKSYVKYGNKNARTYVNLIKKRLDEEEKARQQLE